MSNLKITQKDIMEMVTRSVNMIINEASAASWKKSIINKIYKATRDVTSHLYRDSNWEAVFNAIDIIKNVIGEEGEVDVTVKNGGYWKTAGETPNYKEYLLKINMNNGIEINGSLKCHSAGTMEDPFDRYDITITLW